MKVFYNFGVSGIVFIVLSAILLIVQIVSFSSSQAVVASICGAILGIYLLKHKVTKCPLGVCVYSPFAEPTLIDSSQSLKSVAKTRYISVIEGAKAVEVKCEPFRQRQFLAFLNDH